MTLDDLKAVRLVPTTSDMEGDEAGVLVTLNTSSHSPLTTHATRQFPSCRGNVADTVNRLQEHGVGKPDLR